MPSRRQTLAAAGSALFAGLAGCSSSVSQPEDPPTPADGADPDPERHVHGANGAWSSFGCNAANTRTVADGKAPVDGLTERWRVEVPTLGRAEPVVGDERVFRQLAHDTLVAYDIDDGSERWRVPAESSPLVREGVVYVGQRDHLVAFDAADGTERWRLPLPSAGSVGAPAMLDGSLYVPAGERLYRVDREEGEPSVAWSRRLFGELLGPPAVHKLHYVFVATRAGKLYALDPAGVGQATYALPAQPFAPPTATTEGVFVTCLDSVTYGMLRASTPRLNVDWELETGWTHGIAATRQRLYVAGTHGLAAIEADTGEEAWRHDGTGGKHTAAALGRDTLFVGGDDGLYAFDPTPSVGGGPAKRFSRSFHGSVGAPVVDDGRLYVEATTAEDTRHLLAFE